jgi:hypothetical protein
MASEQLIEEATNPLLFILFPEILSSVGKNLIKNQAIIAQMI